MPPRSMTSSGTAREVIRLWITVAPISLLSSRAATRAVTADGDTGSPRLVDDETPVGVAVEGQPDVGAGRDHVRLQVDEVRRVQRVGLVVGEGAVEFEVQRQHRDRRDRAEHRGRGVAGHPVARVDGDPQRPQVGQIDQRAQEVAVVGEHVAVDDRAGAVRRSAGTPAMTSSLIAASPVSLPTGLAPARHSLMPL